MNIPAEFTKSVKQLATELGLLRNAASFGTFSFGLLAGLIVAAILYYLFRKPQK